MKAVKRIVSIFSALCMTMSLMPQSLAAESDYKDAYSAIASTNYASYNEEYYTNGINFTSNGTDGFVSGEGAWVSYNVDFGEKEADTLVMKMRPDLRNGHGKFGMYVDSLDSEPVATFDESKNIPYAGFATYAGPGVRNFCFNLAEPLTGQHTVYFNAIGSNLATSAFSEFYFLSNKLTAPYEKIVPDANSIAWGKPQSFKYENVNGVSSPVLPIEGGALFVTGVDFGSGETGGVGAVLQCSRWGNFGTGSYEVRLDGVDGDVIGTFDNSEIVSGQYKEYSVKFSRLVTGVHTVVFAVPANTTIAGVQLVEGTAEDVVVPTIPSAYENKAVNVNNAFTSSSASYSFDMDFGTDVPEYLAINMRPALEDAADGGVINVYFDDETSEPAASFTTYRNEVLMLPAGNPAIANEWFAPINVPSDFGGVHKVIFKSEGNARSNFNYFRFDKDMVTRDAYSTILASSYDYTVHNGNTMWGDSYVSAFGEELQDGEKHKTYYSAAYTKLDFGDKTSDKVTVRLNKQSSNSGKVEVRLGSRYGEVIGTLSGDNITAGTNYYDKVADYTIELTKALTGVCDIVFTSDIYTNFYNFSFEGKTKPTEGNKPVSVIDCTEIDGGTFTSSSTGGNVSVYAPVYTSGLTEGQSVKFNLALNDAKYVAVCAKSRNTAADSVVGISKDGTEIASITLPQAGRNGTGWYMDVYTAELADTISGMAEYSVTMKTNTSNVAWIQFMTEEQYNAFANGRTKLALLGDSNVEYGKYTTALREMLDVNEYDLKSLGNSGKTVRNYKQQTQYREALDYAPDIAVFTLGTNDSAQSCNDSYMASFKTDYKELIDGLKAANPNVKVYLQYPLPFKSDAPEDYTNYSTDNLVNKIIPAIHEVADAEGAEIIDIYNGVINYGYDRELLYTDGLHVNEAGGTVMAKLTKSAVTGTELTQKPSVQTANGVEYVVATDAAVINSAVKSNTSAAANYSFRALKGLETPFISGYGDGTVIMLKDVILDNVSAFTVRASNILEVAQKPLTVECRIDSAKGRLIGSTIITKNTNDTKYAFMPYKNAIEPVCDGKAHNLFFVLKRGNDANGIVRAIDGVYSIGFEYGAAKNIAVSEDGVLQDTMPVVNGEYDSTAKFTGYKAGHGYTWKTTTAGDGSTELFIAVYDASGTLKQLAAADRTNNVLSAELTLCDTFDDTYTIKPIALNNTTLKPILKNPALQTTDKITIGCVGDSITNNWNYDNEGYQAYCYPKYLQSMLGTEKYEVMNFGRGTSTASSYKNNVWFERAKAAECDVYIIMLGTNDSKSAQFYESIPEDYQAIIDGLKAANPECKIYINLPVPARGDNYGISDKVIVNEVIPRVKALAEKNGIEPLDLHTMLKENKNFDYMYFSDNIHPNEFGQSFIAECIKDAYFMD